MLSRTYWKNKKAWSETYDQHSQCQKESIFYTTRHTNLNILFSFNMWLFLSFKVKHSASKQWIECISKTLTNCQCLTFSFRGEIQRQSRVYSTILYSATMKTLSLDNIFWICGAVVYIFQWRWPLGEWTANQQTNFTKTQSKCTGRMLQPEHRTQNPNILPSEMVFIVAEYRMVEYFDFVVLFLLGKRRYDADSRSPWVPKAREGLGRRKKGVLQSLPGL